MPNAAWRNFATSERERERRIAMAMDDPADTSSVIAINDRPWNSFFGGLREQGEAANAAGLNYRVDMSGLGRDGFLDDRGYAVMDPNGRPNNNFLRQTLASDEVTQKIQAQNAAQREYVNRVQQGDINDLYTGYINQVQASTLPPPDPHEITKDTTGAVTKYSTRPMPLTPDQQKQRFLASLPPAERAKYEIETAKNAETNRHNMATEAGAVNQDVKDAVTAMKAGKVPPQLPGRASKDYTAIMAEASRQGYDLATAATDWQAAQKHFATLNGSQQTRIRQAVDTAYHSLDVIDQLAEKWNAGKFPLLNRAALAAAKGGAMGKEAQTIATQLDAQITDLTSELGNVYMGGNSPTDHALGLASKNLSSDWSKDVLKDMTQLARQNLEIRRNAIANVGAIGASPQNPYVPSADPASAGGAPVAAPNGRASGPGGSGPVRMQAPDGSIGWVDPSHVSMAEAKGAKRIQ